MNERHTNPSNADSRGDLQVEQSRDDQDLIGGSFAVLESDPGGIIVIAANFLFPSYKLGCKC